MERHKERIDITGQLVINAPAPAVYRALLEFDKFAELSDTFTESHYIEPAADGTPRVYTRIDGCIWFFCKTIERTARLAIEPGKNVTAIAEPEHSDAKLSIESWTVIPNGDTSFIAYDHQLEPGFWVPPLLGVLVIRSTVAKSARNAGVILEGIALASLEENPLAENAAQTTAGQAR